MAKRLTDTEKWKDDWYISLNNDYRVIWQWLLDNCNHAGICKSSIKLLNMMCNTNITEDDLVLIMEKRVIVVENKWFIPNFLKFQYPTLQSSKPVIVSVVNELEKNNLGHLIPESFGNNYSIIKNKDKDKDKDKVSLTQQTNKNGKSVVNFKAQPEELMLKRINEGLSKRAIENGSADIAGEA